MTELIEALPFRLKWYPKKIERVENGYRIVPTADKSRSHLIGIAPAARKSYNGGALVAIPWTTTKLITEERAYTCEDFNEGSRFLLPVLIKIFSRPHLWEQAWLRWFVWLVPDGPVNVTDAMNDVVLPDFMSRFGGVSWEGSNSEIGIVESPEINWPVVPNPRYRHNLWLKDLPPRNALGYLDAS